VLLAVVEPEPTLFGAVWLLTGGFALAAELVVAALWPFISLELVLGADEELAAD